MIRAAVTRFAPLLVAPRLLVVGLLVAGLLTAGPIAAPPVQATESELPVEVEADNGIEWLRDQNMYVARGNAKAIRGDVTINADTLTALYRETDSGGLDIFRLEALGHVIVSTPQREARGDRGVYDVDRGVVVMVGKDLHLRTETDLITANDSLEYWEKEQIAVARGNAVAQRLKNRIRADALTARFVETKEGALDVSRVDAVGNVVITTPREVARGSKGVYYVAKGIATLDGDVRITRGANQLSGEAAEVNLRTGVSRLVPGKGKTNTRVRGLFRPKRGKK